MKKITTLLNEKFTMSIEIVPPRNGSPLDEVWDLLEKIRGKVDFVSVTKGAGGSLRGGTLPISYFAQEKYGLKTIAHFVCREHTKQEIENELMDLHYFGINNILALRGDAPAGFKEETWNGDYKYAYLLIQQIKDLNSGAYTPRIGIDNGPRKGLKMDFCILAAGHPEDSTEEEIAHLRAKIEAGAEVIITQMIFSLAEYTNYVANLRKHQINLPVIPGIRPLTALAQAESAEKFFKLKVAEEWKDGLKQGSEAEAREFGLNHTADLIHKLKEAGAPGVHLFVLNDIKVVEDLLKKM